ncbi:MAG: M23 family metallopeptidase [Anaerolineae bacterium]|nr:M23 family metallopeptidase [Anaerolineae bacterium]MDQ7034700.1 M23 family metallopeptidase [Anaerolineae bacterium]
MTRFPLLGLCVLFLLTLTVAAQDETQALQSRTRPAPTATLNSGGLVLERYFTTLIQGQVGLLHLTGDNIQAARVLFRGREYPFMALDGDGYYALVVADIDAQVRDYPLSVLAQTDTATLITFEMLVTIETAGFLRLNFDIPPNLAYLIDPQIERNEYARLDAIIQDIVPERFWDESGFTLSIEAPDTSGFGQYRILNQTVLVRHTGWDQSAPSGTSVRAMASGEVAFVGQLDIRGNYIIINHGWGVYTGYAHLSQINVERGQTISAGQIIGGVGNSGRSIGSHLHWEVAVNGEWVDGRLFPDLWLP